MYFTILYYNILYYTILYYTIPYYTILYYTILYYTILYYTIPYYTILYYTILYYGTKFATPYSNLLMAGLENRIFQNSDFKCGTMPWWEFLYMDPRFSKPKRTF